MAAAEPEASAFILRIGDYDVNIRNELGQGAWGTVYKGRHKDRKTVVAAKKMRLDPKVPEARDLVRNESELLLKVKNHPYLLKIHHAQFIDQPYLKFHEFWIITSFCREGNLNEYCMAHILSLKEKLRICRQTAAGLAFLHNLKPCIIHRDLKPENIFLDIVDGDLTAKLGDFGLARNMEQTFLSTMAGTQSYVAPEMWPWSKGRRLQYDEKIDTFALGLVQGLLLRQKTKKPLHDLGNTMPLGQQMVIADEANKPLPVAIEIEKTDDEMTVKWKGLILQMTAYDPSQRPSMEHVEEELAAMQEDLVDETESASSGSVVTPSGSTKVPRGEDSAASKTGASRPQNAIQSSRPNPSTSNITIDSARSDTTPASRGEDSASAHFSNNDISIPVQFKKLSSLRLITYYSTYLIGVNENYVLEPSKKDGQLRKWDLSNDQIGFSVPLPNGVSADCRKFLGPQGEMVLWQEEQKRGFFLFFMPAKPRTTYIFDSKGSLQGEYPVEDTPIAVISRGVVYVHDEVNLVVRSLVDHSQVLTLACDEEFLSICEEPITGKLAVTVWGNRTLLIFSPSGERLVQKKLTYEPRYYQAVTCVSERLFAVADNKYNTVHLYDWSSGDELQEVTWQQLGLIDYGYIRQMWMGPDRVFYIIVGGKEICRYQL